MLTPIRVRGRRKKRVAPPVPSLDESQTREQNGSYAAPSSSLSARRKGGRPLMSSQARLTLSQSQVNRRARWLAAKPIKEQKRQLSILESLPIELIETIFLYSSNVNFPRASPILAAAVSTERIYRALIVLAFWDDDPPSETDIYNPTIARILRPLDYRPMDREERADLQSTILRCRWCTADRILNQLPDLMRLTIQRRWIDAGITMGTDRHAALDRFLSQKQDMRTFEGEDGNKIRYTLTIEPLVSITVRCHENDQEQSYRFLGVTGFPDKLLRGDEGFGEDDVRLLETFRIASGFNRVDPLPANVSLSRDALQQGIHNALLENNAHALTVLLKIDESFVRSQNAAVSDSTTTTTPPYTLPAEHFRTAVRVARNDPTLFQLLLRTSAESIPGDDSEITQWAMDRDDAFGPWLLDLMLHLPRITEAARENPRDAALFYMGRANPQAEMARRYLAEVLHVADLPSWMDKSEFDVSRLWKVLEEEDE